MSIPYVVSEAVWSAKEASETVVLKTDFEKCRVTIIEIATTGFSGTLDIQGKLHELGSYANVPYIRQDQASIQTPSVSQVSLTTNTGTYRYVILGYWRRLQLVMTRTAGSITCGVVGSSGAQAFPYLVTQLIAGTAAIGKLAANSGVDIGDVDILSIAAGSNLIGRIDHGVTGVGDGRKTITTAGAREALASSTSAKYLKLIGLAANTNLVVWGGATVVATAATRRGQALAALESSDWIPIDNLADIYLDVVTSGEGVCFVYLT